MKNFKIALILILTFFAVGVSIGQNYEKRAQAGFQFMNMSNDARISALGEAGTSLESNSAAVFYNPAGMARLNNLVDVTMGKIGWIADINYYYAGVAVAPFERKYGVFGLSFLSVDYGDIIRTVRSTDDSKGYVELGTFKPFAGYLGLSYANELSDKFSIGATVRYATQNLGDDQVVSVNDDGSYGKKSYSKSTLAYDFGVIYKTGLKSLTLGLNIRNFSEEIKYETEGFQLPLIFKIGLSMNIMELFPSLDQNMHKFLVSVDASHPRDYQEQLSIGGEYLFMNTVALRVGYMFPEDEKGISAGIGLQQKIDGFDFGFDYAYTTFGVFSDVHRFSVRFAL